MPTIRLRNWFQARRAVTQLRTDISPTPKGRTGELWRIIGRELRNEARRNISSQDGGSYEPLSKWTRARTGRRKALVSERKHIHFRFRPARLEVYYNMHRGFTLTQHHKGYTIKPKNRKVSIPLRNPGLLNNKSWRKAKAATFVDRKPKKVPARKIWPDENKVVSVTTKAAFTWGSRVTRRAAQFAAKRKVFP